MSLYPKAAIRLLPESGKQPRITPRTVILHSAAGRGSLHDFFANSSNLESHFWVSDTGLVEQYMDTGRRADANLHANGFAVSIETESSREATERWTDPQAAAIVALVRWLCDEHDIPARQCQSPTGAGIGWHIMWGAPGPWTPVSKSCPGPARIDQCRDEIIPAVASAAQHPKDEPLMVTDDDAKKIEAIVNKALDARLDPDGKGNLLVRIRDSVAVTEGRVKRLLGKG